MRISRVFLLQNDFNAHISSLKDWFLARDYPQKFIGEQINQLVFGKQANCKDTSEQGVTFVATYHPKLKDLGKLIKNCSYIVIARLKEFFHLLLLSLIEVLGK